MSQSKVEQKVVNAQKALILFNRYIIIILIVMMLGILVLVSTMLAINVVFGPGYNIPFFLISTIFFVSIVLSPASLLTSSLLGAAYGWLNKKSMREGVSLGLKTLLGQILFGGLTILQVTTGFLATWPFEKNPAAFFYVLCGSILLTTISTHFRLGLGRFFSIVVVIYTGAVIIIALWTTLPEGVIDSWSTSNPHQELSENGPLSTTGKIQLERTFGNPQVFALADTYRRIDVPPSAELCADPIHMVYQGQESTPAVRFVRSNIEGTVVNVHFYFMPYGESCVLLPTNPGPKGPD